MSFCRSCSRFLSTLSLRRATVIASRVYEGIRFLSTLSLRRATVNPYKLTMIFGISIHALLAESDSKPRRLKSRRCVFLSTLSLRRATIFALLTVPGLRLFLSTLSLRRATVAPPLQFNDTSKFLSTLSLRRATLYKLSCQGTPEFLSTLSLRRATRGACRARPQSRPHFYPRSPCGERPCRKRRQWFHHGNFYPRSPCGERHQGQKVQDQEGHISIHALLAESDICIASGISVYIEFLSTLSLRRATAREGR